MSKVGIENLKDAATIVCNIAKAGKTTLADGFQPLPDLFAMAPSLMTANGVYANREQILEELKDLDSQESVDFENHVEAQLAGITKEQVVDLIGSVANWIGAGKVMISDFIELNKPAA